MTQKRKHYSKQFKLDSSSMPYSWSPSRALMYQKLLVTLASTTAPLGVGKGSWLLTATRLSQAKAI
jgi:hypothetical protein